MKIAVIKKVQLIVYSFDSQYSHSLNFGGTQFYIMDALVTMYQFEWIADGYSHKF